MKKNVLLFICAGLFTVCATASRPDYSSLRHFYHFEAADVAADYRGEAHGEALGGATIHSGILDLSTAGAYLSLPAQDIMINTYSALTVEIWVTANNIVNDPNPNMLWSFGRFGNPGFYYLFFTPARWGNGVVARMSISPTAPWANEQGLAGTLDIGDDVLTHWVLTINTDRVMNLYANGQLVNYTVDAVTVPATATLTGSHGLDSLSTESAFIGRSVYSPDPTWRGTVELYSIWNAALTPEEVKWLYDQGAKRELTVNIPPSEMPSDEINAFVTDNRLYVEAEDAMNLSVTIFNMMGSVVYQTNNFQNGQLLNLTPGVYVVKVDADSGTAVQKVIIK